MEKGPFIIAGSGRSGTTWVLDAIAESNKLRTVFEPLHPIGVPAAGRFANCYVPEDAHDPALASFMDVVLSGNLKSLWANYRIRPDRLHPRNLRNKEIPVHQRFGKLKFWYTECFVRYLKYRPEQRRKTIIVKFIRANLMLGWLSKRYHAPIVLVLRHPGAVISSKLKLGGPDWTWEKPLRQYRNDQRLVDTCPAKAREILFKNLSPVAAHTAIWCIENMVPFGSSESAKYVVVFYENLVRGGISEWRRIVDSLGLDAVPEAKKLHKPSQQASFDLCDNQNTLNALDKWISHFNQMECAEMQTILDVFQVPFYGMSDIMPLNKEIELDRRRGKAYYETDTRGV